MRVTVLSRERNAVLIWGWVHRYHTDPSGTFIRYDAKAIGSGSEAAQAELQEKWNKVRSL